MDSGVFVRLLCSILVSVFNIADSDCSVPVTQVQVACLKADEAVRTDAKVLPVKSSHM